MNRERRSRFADAAKQQNSLEADMTKVVVVSSAATVRRALREHMESGTVLEGRVAVVEAGTGHDGLVAVRKHRPEAVLVDSDLPGLSGRAIAGTVSRNSLGVTVILLVPVVDFDHLSAAVDCGVIPLRRDAGDAELRRALGARRSEADRFHPWPIPPVDAGYADGFVPGWTSPNAITLTDGQAAVLDCLLTGVPARRIAQVLETTDYRVRKDLDGLLNALGARSKVHAVAAAFERGWTSGGRPPGVVRVERAAALPPGGIGPREPLRGYADLWEYSMS
jgi:DNA-binding NarL/FixJ family response regulator